ncbi:MAG: hypothetical protein ABL883_10640 [Terricaulis sp.]
MFAYPAAMATPCYFLHHLQTDALLLRKQRYRRLVGFAIGATGVAAALVGMPLLFSLGLWGVGALAWARLKAA